MSLAKGHTLIEVGSDVGTRGGIFRSWVLSSTV